MIQTLICPAKFFLLPIPVITVSVQHIVLSLDNDHNILYKLENCSLVLCGMPQTGHTLCTTNHFSIG